MNIGIVGRTMNQIGGVKEVVEGFCYGLSKIDTEGDSLFFFMTESGPEPAYTGSISIVKKGSANRIAWDFAVLPKLVKEYNIDVLIHMKNTIPPSVLKVPSVLVVHDLLYFIEPEVYRWLDQFYTRTFMKVAVPRANAVIAVSHNTKKDLLSYFPKVADEKVLVVHESAMPKFAQEYSEEELAAFRDAHDIPKDYLLFTGSLSPRKNLERLLKALSSIREDIPHHLVMTGGKAWKHQSIYDVLQEHGLEDRVHILGFIEDHEMPLLYKNASAYIYPSLYEGFGIPVLEAFNGGIPVICSNVSSIPEVAGDAAAFFNPEDVVEMATVIKTTLNDPQRMEELRRKGLERSKTFSWEKAAGEILSIARSVK